MSITKSYHRNYRAIKKGFNSGYSGWAYIVDRQYSTSPGNFIRGHMPIQNDLQKLFEYIEPSKESLETYSYRIHELLMMTYIEVEANCKAILTKIFLIPK